jgi:Protein of unknown function (DUF2516)
VDKLTSMASAASVPAFTIVVYGEYFLLLMFVVVDLVAFVHCLLQKKEAFSVVGSIPKVGWLAISGVGALLTYLLYGILPIVGFVVFTACLFYLLDVRIGLRDAAGGHWR